MADPIPVPVVSRDANLTVIITGAPGMRGPKGDPGDIPPGTPTQEDLANLEALTLALTD